VPIWQIVSPALSPDGKWMAQALTDGFTTNLWALSTATGEWRQITDFGERSTFIVRRVSLVVRRALYPSRSCRGQLRYRSVGRADD
jgi:hypothetical protein